MFVCFSTAKSYKVYGIITPPIQALKYNELGGITCHSTSPPKWSYINYLDLKKKSRKTKIPYSVSIGNSLLITKSGDKETIYYCKGTFPNNSYFTTDAMILRAGKHIVYMWVAYNTMIKCSTVTLPEEKSFSWSDRCDVTVRKGIELMFNSMTTWTFYVII